MLLCDILRLNAKSNELHAAVNFHCFIFFSGGDLVRVYVQWRLICYKTQFPSRVKKHEQMFEKQFWSTDGSKYFEIIMTDI